MLFRKHIEYVDWQNYQSMLHAVEHSAWKSHLDRIHMGEL